MVKLYYYLIFALFIMQYNLFGENFHMSKAKRDSVNNLLNRVERNLCNRYNMSCVGSGGAMMYEVEDLSLMFSINRPLDRNQIRRIVVDSAELFLRSINNDQSIKKFLRKYPFTIDDICLSILMNNYDGTSMYHPDLNSVGLVKGNIRYHTIENNDSWNYKQTIVESFDEAKQILEGQER